MLGVAPAAMPSGRFFMPGARLMEIRMPHLLALAIETILRILAALLADAARAIGHGFDRPRGRWSRHTGIAAGAGTRSRDP
jgi:hypothetical protein